MNTDSTYIAISGDSIEDLVKPEMKDEFEVDKCNWFPQTDMVENAHYNKRTPGCISLCGKTYYCFGVGKINLVVRV